jgi:hypothetical protein
MVRVVVLIVALCAMHGDARAQPAKADALVREAETLAGAGDFLGAAAKYRDAYAADPRVDLMCNVGIAFHKAKDLPRAQLYLSHCLKRGTALEAQFVAAVRGVLATVEGALKQGDFTPVDIVVDPEATVVAFGDASFVGSHLVWFPYGQHTLTFHAEGFIDQTIEITAAARATTPLAIKLEKKPDPAPIVIVKPAPKIKRSARSMYPAIGASAFTLGATIFAIVAFQRAHDRADIAAFAVREEVYEADKAYVSKWNTRLAISGAFAVLGAGASGFLWYRALTPATKVELTPTSSGATVTFRTRF